MPGLEKLGNFFYAISTNCLQNTFYTFPACKEEGGEMDEWGIVI